MSYLFPTPVLVFDLETIPDCHGLRRLYPEQAHLTDAELAEFAFDSREQKTGKRFLPPHLQRIAAISCVFRNADQLKVKSLGEPADSEEKLMLDFFKTIERYTPQLISWNGSGFDLPVLLQRAIINGLEAPRLLEWGDHDRDFKFQNYVNRYHTRHLDLMDFLSMYQMGTRPPLDEMAKLCGLPGKLGMDGSQVWPAFLEGKINDIRDYCETDVMNTYGVFVRFQLLRGMITRAQHDAEMQLIYQTAQQLDKAHWQAYTGSFDRRLHPYL